MPTVILVSAATRQVAATTLEFFASSSVVSPTTGIVLPAGIEQGDLIVLHDSKANSSGTPPTSVTPTGFTVITTGTLFGLRVNMFYKIADGTEGGTTVTGMTGNAGGMLCAVFRANQPISEVAAQDVASEVTNTIPSTQTINASSGVSPMVAIAAWTRNTTLGGNAITPRTFSPAEDGEVSNATSTARYMKYKIYNSSPQSHTVSMDDEGTGNALMSFYLEVA